MNTQILFNTQNGTLTNTEMLEELHKIDAHNCDVLYIHTDMNFGLPIKGMKRKTLLAALYELIKSLNVKTLVFPTFTFSFCNKENYDVQKTKTAMGSLNEYIRLNVEGVRTLDPLLSVYVIGDPLNLVDNLGEKSLGDNSNYDRIHKCGKHVKFLFFGADMCDCFTYTHQLEAVAKSPYRYYKSFEGTIINNGMEYKNKRALLFSTYANCNLGNVPVVYNAMLKKGQLQQVKIGDSNFCCFNEIDSYETIMELLAADTYCLTDGQYDPSIKDISYAENERIISVL